MMREKLLSMMLIVMTPKNTNNHETCHHDFNFHFHDSYFVEFAPTTIHENKFAYVESNKISMLMYHLKECFM